MAAITIHSSGALWQMPFSWSILVDLTDLREILLDGPSRFGQATLGSAQSRPSTALPLVATWQTNNKNVIGWNTRWSLARPSTLCIHPITGCVDIRNSVRIRIYSVSLKNCTHFVSSITLSNVDRFLTCVSHTANVIAIGWMSVCPSHASIVLKRLNLSSNCLHCLVAPWF